MIILILPDIHDKIARAQAIISGVPHDRRIFLGDFFDDFTTGVVEARATAEQVKVWLHDPLSTVLLGNHDMSYGWGWKNRALTCSGWTREKSDTIHAVLQPDDWGRFQLAAWLTADVGSGWGRPWLLTHAGFHGQFIPVGTGTSKSERELAIQDGLSAATISLHAYRMHRLLGAGWSRGGEQAFGGVVWCDWNEEFMPVPGVNQLVGHTPGTEPRVKKTKASLNICLDTHLAHFATYDSATGKMRVETTDKVLGMQRGKVL